MREEIRPHLVECGDELPLVLEAREGGLDVDLCRLRGVRSEDEQRGAPRQRDPDPQLRPASTLADLKGQLKVDCRDNIRIADIKGVILLEPGNTNAGISGSDPTSDCGWNIHKEEIEALMPLLDNTVLRHKSL